jgi:hypothetical protein
MTFTRHVQGGWEEEAPRGMGPFRKPAWNGSPRRIMEHLEVAFHSKEL